MIVAGNLVADALQLVVRSPQGLFKPFRGACCKVRNAAMFTFKQKLRFFSEAAVVVNPNAIELLKSRGQIAEASPVDFAEFGLGSRVSTSIGPNSDPSK